MRYALFTNKQDADSFAEIIQSLCDVNQQAEQPRIVKMSIYVQHLGKYAVRMEYEPDLTGIEVVDSIEPEEMEELE